MVPHYKLVTKSHMVCLLLFFYTVEDCLLSSHRPLSSQSSIYHTLNSPTGSSQNTNWQISSAQSHPTAEQKSGRGESDGEKHCLEIGDACMEYRSDKWRTLSAPASKIGPNLLICSCQLCFCVTSNTGQLRGTGSKCSEALFTSYLYMSFCILACRDSAWPTATHFLHTSVVFNPHLTPSSSSTLPSLTVLLHIQTYLILRACLFYAFCS